MDLTSRTAGDMLVISVNEARIDAAAAIRFKDRFRDLATEAPGRIVLDLAQVDFVDSSGLGAIVSAMKQLKPGQSMELAALRPNVDRVFRLTRMDSVFPIRSSVEEAEAHDAQ